MQKIIRVVLIAGCAVCGWSCSIRAPEIAVTGEKTALENQVIGQFQQLGAGSDVIASSRSFDPLPSGKLSENVLDAVRDQKFRRDEINELKRARVVGEGNEGFLAILATERYQSEPPFQKRVDQLVLDENTDRQAIYNRLLALQGQGAAAADSVVRAQWVKLNAQESEPGTLIQMPDGEWTEKETLQ